MRIANVVYDYGKREDAVGITVKCRISPPINLSAFSVTYLNTIEGSGALTNAVNMNSIRSKLSCLPRVGLDLCLHNNFNQVAWHDKGPQQSHKDSCASTRKGIITSKISTLELPIRYFPGEQKQKQSRVDV